MAQLNDADLGGFVPGGLPSTDAPGDTIGCPVILEEDPAMLGVEFAWGYYFVSARGSGVVGGQFLFQYDEDWNLVETYVQQSAATPWGGRDGEAIESENALFFGAENGELVEYRWDPSTERLDLSQTVTITVAGVGTIRALAWDPNNEVFYTKNFGNPVYVFDRAGNLINLFANDARAYGAAYDPTTQTVWFHDYRIGASGSCDAPATRLVEWDPATGDYTGAAFDTDPAGDTSGFFCYIAGGLDIEVNGSDVTAIALSQAVAADQTTSVDFVQRVAITGDGVPCGGDPCRADLDGDGVLTIFDFLAFQNEFDAGC
jgi:hypothetical protein